MITFSNKKQNRVMIFGAAGFIGTNLTYRLLKDDIRPICVDLPGKDLSFVEERGARVIYGSIKDLNDEICDALDGTDIVYHLVSTTCPSNSDQRIVTELEDNVLATVKLLDACVKHKVGRVVFLSSGGTVYGREHKGVLSEADPTNPISGYGIQKLVIEKYLYLYRELYKLDYRIVRLSNPYGPHQRPDGVQGLVAACTWKFLHGEPIEIYGDGSVVRDYIYIDDAIQGILNIASDSAKYRLYNLGSGVGRTVSDIVESVAYVLHVRPRIEKKSARHVDVPVNILDITRYEAEFGNPITIELDEGIWRLADFYERI
ncbi:MAG: NAD-dependent epimerase/dehydratase family protein [Lachnospiraceae bacterium]|nr:NAD-dependent epimerase/dehydratase family protein [Lachnospiraceae bacterium]